MDNVYDYTKIIGSPINVSRRRVTFGLVNHVDPLGVLCARDLIEPVTGTPAVTVNADMDVREIIEQFGRGEEPTVGVLDGDQLIGQISTDRILAKLVDPRG